MKWLITGANGQLGRCIQKTLDAQGINFVALSRTDLDITNTSLVKESIHSIGPDVVINTAAYTNVEQAEVDSAEAFKINQLGVANIAIASKSIGARLVHFSTDYVFSGKKSSPWEIDDITEPISVYGESKLAGEFEILKEYPENSVIIRTAWLYSNFGKNFYKTILNKALNSSEHLEVVNDQYGQPTSALELAELTVRAATNKVEAGTFHATNSGSCSWFDFARYIFELAGENINRVQPISSKSFKSLASRPDYSVLDNEKWLDFGIDPLGEWKETVRFSYLNIRNSLT
jgi:dTDP-4-dehydrorhamnose reductase